jgi:signal transduction histidine kinase
MTKTADEFQDFYKPSKEKKEFCVKSQIKSVESIMSKQLIVSGIKLNLDGDDLLSSTGFDSEFKQVVLNIVNNAKDAILEKNPENPRIDINVFLQDSFINITIADNAGGIDANLLPHKIFEQFVTTKGKDGTGVGLSLCKTIITERFNGTLFAENINNGACFTIKIPC